jgi:hypothetical protein
MHKLAAATLFSLCACCAAQAQAQEEFRAGLTLRAGFGGRAEQNWTPHLLASFGSGPQFLQQSRSAESQCLMTAGDLRISGAMASSSACDAAPLVQVDLGGGGLSSANLLGLNLMKAPTVLRSYQRDLLSGNSEWVQWTLKEHINGNSLDPRGITAGSPATDLK